MKKPTAPEPDHDDAPELTDDLLARARPGREVLPAEVLANFRRPPGRPRLAEPKVPVSIRLSPRVIAHFKGDNPDGWQKRVSDLLEAAAGVKR